MNTHHVTIAKEFRIQRELEERNIHICKSNGNHFKVFINKKFDNFGLFPVCYLIITTMMVVVRRGNLNER